MIYFLSDTHFYHRLVAGYRKRNFEVELLQNIFAIVRKDDVLFHLGDFTWEINDSRGILATWNSIPARKILVMGNHDKKFLRKHKNWNLRDYFDDVVDFYHTLNYNGCKFLLSHYPASDPFREKHKEVTGRVRELFKEGNFDLLIHGHVHESGRGIKCRCYEDYKIPCFNVNIEFTDYRPVSIEEIIVKKKLNCPGNINHPPQNS